MKRKKAQKKNTNKRRKQADADHIEADSVDGVADDDANRYDIPPPAGGTPTPLGDSSPPPTPPVQTGGSNAIVPAPAGPTGSLSVR